MSNASAKAEQAIVESVEQPTAILGEPERVFDASGESTSVEEIENPISNHPAKTETPPDLPEENVEKPDDNENSESQAANQSAYLSVSSKKGKRSREEYEQKNPESGDPEEERLPPLPIPKRIASTKLSLSTTKEPETSKDIGESGEPTPVEPEAVPLPSSSSDTSSSPSTPVNEDRESTPKIIEIPSEPEILPQRVSKRRRITDTFKGLFNVFGDTVTSVFSSALDH